MAIGSDGRWSQMAAGFHRCQGQDGRRLRRPLESRWPPAQLSAGVKMAARSDVYWSQDGCQVLCLLGSRRLPALAAAGVKMAARGRVCQDQGGHRLIAAEVKMAAAPHICRAQDGRGLRHSLCFKMAAGYDIHWSQDGC